MPAGVVADVAGRRRSVDFLTGLNLEIAFVELGWQLQETRPGDSGCGRRGFRGLSDRELWQAGPAAVGRGLKSPAIQVVLPPHLGRSNWAIWYWCHI